MNTSPMTKLVVLALMALFLFATPVVAADKPLVVFANPGGKDDAFFGLMTGFMQAAADDLGFEFEVYYGDRNHVLIDDNVQTIFKRKRLPDYLIGMNARGSGVTILQKAEAAGVKTVFINQSFLGKVRTEMGLPGEIYKNWLFEYLPDDVHSGYLLAKALIDEALEKGMGKDDGTLHMVGINGHEKSAASTLRAQGLRQAVSEYPNVTLNQIINADWKRERAYELTRGLLSRYKEMDVIWSASDVMALGIVDGIRDSGGLPGVTELTGGVDWANSAMEKVKMGEFTATVGGHFMDGGWALVMLYDLINGVDIPKTSRSRFSVLTEKNVAVYTDQFGSNDWSRVDFRKFSKHLNPKIKEYDFGLEGVLKQVQ